MPKRAALVFLLSLLVIVGYNYYLAKKYPPSFATTPLEPPQSPAVPASGLAARQASATAAAEQTPVYSAGALKKAKDIVVETDLMKLVLTSSGARIKSCQLKAYPEEKLDLKSVQGQIREIDRALPNLSAEQRKLGQREKKKLLVLLEQLGPCPHLAEMISAASTVDADFPPTLIFPADPATSAALNTQIFSCPQPSLVLTKDQPQGQLEFSAQDSQGRSVQKIFSFSNSNYDIGLEVNFAGWENAAMADQYFLLFLGPNLGWPQAERGKRTLGYSGPLTCFLNGQQGWIKKESYARPEQNIFVRRENSGKIGWVGLENKYFLAALIPPQPLQTALVEKNQYGEHRVALKIPWAGAPQAYNFRLYLGPKKKENLEALGVSLEKAIDYGFFAPIAQFIYRILVFFSRWTHNFGWAIVLLCLIVKIIFYPLTQHSLEAMQKMQQQMKLLQPEMDAARAKYKDEPQKLNKELAELYRKKGINPLASCQSGCLPLLLQMPVFFALYAVLYNAIELRGAAFIGWITDLSAKDPYYILPILMGISMFVQQKLTGVGPTSGVQQEQAKMMAVLMPLLLTWVFASLPSGVVLYWLTFNLLTALQQVVTRKSPSVMTI